MRILFVVPYIPNLIRVRPYNLIRQLSARGHEVTVLTLSSDAAEREDASALSEHCHRVIDLPLSKWRSLWNCLAALPSNKPLQSVYCWQPALADQLSQLVNGNNGQMLFDVVHVEHLRGVRYGLRLNAVIGAINSHLPVVWDSVDCISELFKQAAVHSRSAFGRWVTRFELGRTGQYEGWLLSQFAQVLVTSPVDKQALVELAPVEKQLAQVHVLPNGVDLDYFTPDPAVTRDDASLVVSGKMSYHANITMVSRLVQEIMPLVWAHQPEVKVVIAGKDPSRDIQQLAENPLITVTGTISDLRPYLRQATIAVAPITYGAGIQNKVLEAMACGTPVIVSQQAMGALEAIPDQDLLVAEDVQAFARQILDLVVNPARQKELGTNGRAYVESHHNWEVITSQLEEIYQTSIHQAP